MKEIYTWLSIFSVVAFSTAGDVLISNAMKRVGDVGPLYTEDRSCWSCEIYSGKWHFMDGSHVHGRQLLQPAAGALVGRCKPGRSSFCVAHLFEQRPLRQVFPARTCGPTPMDGSSTRGKRRRPSRDLEDRISPRAGKSAIRNFFPATVFLLASAARYPPRTAPSMVAGHPVAVQSPARKKHAPSRTLAPGRYYVYQAWENTSRKFP